MSQDIRKRIHRIYGIAYIAVTVIAGICFILSALALYKTGLAQGTQPYTRELVAQSFARIAVPVYLCLAMTIGGFILHLALPVEQKKTAPEKNLPLILSRLRAKAELQQCDAQLHGAIRRQQNARKLHTAISILLTALCAIVFLTKACDQSYWPDPAYVTDAMIGIMPLFAACVLIPLAYIIFTAFFCRSSLQKEIELVKHAPKSAQPQSVKARKQLPALAAHILQALCILLGIGFIIYGVAFDGIEGVIAKAVAICTECIGLG